MEEKISFRQFELRQPPYKREESEEQYYFILANRLNNLAIGCGLLKDWDEQVVARASMGITGYFQDILADCGLWRSFIDMNRHLYNRTLPFFEIGDNYIDYELNFEDVRFLLWYSLALNSEDNRFISPLDKNIERVARKWYEELESVYNEAPIPISYQMGKGLELTVPEERMQVYQFGSWVFMYSYLMSPAYSMTMLEMMNEPVMRSQNIEAIEQRIEQSMIEDPTGPLALFLGEWLSIILEGKFPKETRTEKTEEEKALNPTYTKFIEATGGSIIKFIGDYNELNNFFVEKLGWAKGEEHLPQMKNSTGFVLLVSPEKGMLLAKEIAPYISHPENPYYNKEHALKHAIELLTIRGKCPADLLKYLGNGGYLPDAHFDGSDDFMLVKENFDFISRCYLQLYYRGD